VGHPCQPHRPRVRAHVPEHVRNILLCASNSYMYLLSRHFPIHTNSHIWSNTVAIVTHAHHTTPPHTASSLPPISTRGHLLVSYAPWEVSCSRSLEPTTAT
jgi:hypothetical protein